MIEMIEPCCYTKQFNELMKSTSSDSVSVFHSGDVLASHIIDRVATYAAPKSTMWIVMPSITPSFIKCIEHYANFHDYDANTNTSPLRFTNINIITRDVTDDIINMKLQPTQTLTVALDRQLGMRIIGSTSEDESKSMFITGSIIQSSQFGAHMLTVLRGKLQHTMLVPYLSRQLKFHKSYTRSMA